MEPSLKRPTTPYFKWRSENLQLIKNGNPQATKQELKRIVSKAWENYKIEMKNKFEEESDRWQELHTKWSEGRSSDTSKKGEEEEILGKKREAMLRREPAAEESQKKRLKKKPLNSRSQNFEEEKASGTLAQAYMLRANEEYHKKNYKSAIESFSKVIELKEHEALCFANRAECHSALKDFKSCIEDCTSALSLNPSYFKVLHLRAHCFKILGNMDSAKEDLKMAIKKNDPDSEALAEERQECLNLEMSFSRLKKAAGKNERSEAIPLIKSLLSKAPYWDAVQAILSTILDSEIRGNNIETVKSVIEELRSIRIAEWYFWQGQIAYFEGDMAEAQKCFAKSYNKEGSTKAQALLLRAGEMEKKTSLGLRAQGVGNLREAVEIFSEALSFDKNNNKFNGSVHYFLARVFKELKRGADALKECTKAVELGTPHSYDAYYLKAALNHELGNFADALGDYDFIQRNFQKNTTQKKEKIKKEAVQLIKTAIENGKKAADSKNFELALKCFSEAVGVRYKEDDLKASAYKERALVFLKMNKFKEAFDDCMILLNQNSSSVEAYLIMSAIKIAQGNYKGAIQDYKIIRRINPWFDVEDLINEARKALLAQQQKQGSSNYYTIIGVDKKATTDEITKAYKQLALKLHPDKNTGSENARREAGEKFKEVTNAYQVLRDPAKRRAYDIKIACQASESTEEDTDCGCDCSSECGHWCDCDSSECEHYGNSDCSSESSFNAMDFFFIFR